MTQAGLINKYDVYNARMSLSMFDKLFFLDKTDATLFVDYGCADGTLLKHLNDYLPEAILVGYDNDSNMLNHAIKNLPPPKAAFYSNWEDLVDYTRNPPKSRWPNAPKRALILSSIVHEVYHYSEPKEIDTFWTKIFAAEFDYIIIRDMIPSETIDRSSDVNDVMKVLRKYRDTKELKDFERRWGSITNNKNLAHFLLKYTYTTPNWDREVKENYIPLYFEDLLAMIPNQYSVLFSEHNVLPFIKRQVRTDFGIDMKDAIHLKMVLERT